MQRQTADTLAAGLLALVLLGGGALYWLATQQPTGGMMGSMPGGGTMHGPSLFAYTLGTLLVVVVLGGGYLIFRQTVLVPDSTAGDASPSVDAADASDTDDTADAHTQVEAADASATDDAADTALQSAPEPTRQLLDILPEDERRVLSPVLASPGITQIALRDKSDFSKSKVSQTLSALEKRGLLYREKQGRTYRVYPAEDLPDRLDTSA